jgi:hypothetical protein
MRRARNRAMRHDADPENPAHLSLTDLAQKYELTRRQVWNVLAEDDEDAPESRQAGLF